MRQKPRVRHYCAAQSRVVTVAPGKSTIENLPASYPAALIHKHMLSCFFCYCRCWWVRILAVLFPYKSDVFTRS